MLIRFLLGQLSILFLLFLSLIHVQSFAILYYLIKCLSNVISVGDVNECQTANPCVSPATCHNTQESYYCTCPSGYVLKADNKNQCEGIIIKQDSFRILTIVTV